jgi:CSLREA domain-containing protein
MCHRRQSVLQDPIVAVASMAYSRGSIFLALLAATAPAFASTFTVTKTSDTNDGHCDADCSLREAVRAANAAPGPDVIRLRHAWYGLTRTPEADDDNAVAGDLDVTDDVVIRGLADRSVIDARGIDRVLEILPGASVEITDVTLKGGRVGGRGGCVYNSGNLILRRVWVTRCSVFLDQTAVLDGAGIFNLGVLRLLTAKVYLNRAQEQLTGGRGGGIFNAAGAAIYMYDSDVRQNLTGLDDAPGAGAGLFNWGAVRIDRSFFYRNDPGGGEGSAIANREGATLVVANTTISGNGHDGANGAIANGSTQQGASEPQSKLNLLNVTIADNNGGGLFNNGRVNMRNTLIAGNFTQDANDRWYDAGRNCQNAGSGNITSNYVLMGGDGNCPGTIVVNNATVLSEVLYSLAYLGGPTPIHRQRQGPYTIDTGDPAICPSWDQRLARRPADGDGNGSELCDIGAAEEGADE